MALEDELSLRIPKSIGTSAVGDALTMRGKPSGASRSVVCGRWVIGGCFVAAAAVVAPYALLDLELNYVKVGALCLALHIALFLGGFASLGLRRREMCLAPLNQAAVVTSDNPIPNEARRPIVTSCQGAPRRPPRVPPAFIVGCPRSGTTLLAVQVSRHSEFAVPPETQFIPLTYKHSSRVTSLKKLLAALRSNRRAAECGYSVADLEQWLKDQPVSHGALFEALLADYALRQGKRRCVEKSPEHLLEVPLILEWFPDARIVCIVRDGRDVAVSLRNVPWTHNILRFHGLTWRRFAAKTLEFERAYPKNFLRIHFEALVNNPRAELTRVMSFFGAEFEESQLETSLPSTAIPAWEAAWKAKAGAATDSSRCGSWRQAISAHELFVLNSTMSPYLAQFGYSETEATSESAWERCINTIKNALCKLVLRPALDPVRVVIRPLFGCRDRSRPQ